MDRTAELPLMLYAPGDSPVEFTAEFTVESPLCFDVRPGRGVLPVAPNMGIERASGGGAAIAQEGRRREDGGGVERGGHAAAAAAAVAAAPITVLYTCKDIGRVMRGRLVVHAAGSQHVYEVRGRVPQYMPPDKKALRSTLLDPGVRGGTGKAAAAAAAGAGAVGVGGRAGTADGGGHAQSSSRGAAAGGRSSAKRIIGVGK